MSWELQTQLPTKATSMNKAKSGGPIGSGKDCDQLESLYPIQSMEEN